MKTLTISLITATFTWVLAIVSPATTQDAEVRQIMQKDYTTDVEYIKARNEVAPAEQTLDFDAI